MVALRDMVELYANACERLYREVCLLNIVCNRYAFRWPVSCRRYESMYDGCMPVHKCKWHGTETSMLEDLMSKSSGDLSFNIPELLECVYACLSETETATESECEFQYIELLEWLHMCFVDLTESINFLLKVLVRDATFLE